MLEHDLHVHTIRSQCGTMTLGEVVATAARRGMRSVGITDHALAFNPNPFQFHILCKRVPDEMDGVQVYKGIELNVLDTDGAVDVPMDLLGWFDYVAIGLHPLPQLLHDLGEQGNTDALIAALRRNPWIDVINHPTQFSHPLDLDRLLDEMAAQGIAFEINDCNTFYRKSDPAVTAAMAVEAVSRGVPLVANSDAHVACELGRDDSIDEVFGLAGLQREIAVNAREETLVPFIESRRERRKAWVAAQG